MNKYAIKLVNKKWLYNKLISNLKPIKSKIFGTDIEIKLANRFI